MQIFDLSEIEGFPYEQREKNVFYQADEFKARIIVLPPGGGMPPCEMAQHVIFHVLDGAVQISANTETALLTKNHCLITKPATISMKTKNGARLMGIQITVNGS